MKARHSIKEFVTSLCAHIKSIYEYLISVIKDKPLQVNLALIRESTIFSDFEGLFHQKYTGYTPFAVEDMILNNFERIELSFNQAIEQVAKNVVRQVSDIHMDILKKL